MSARPGDERFEVRWFDWRAVREALAYGRAGGIALHRFRHDLRRFGLGADEPACHMLSADRDALVAFAARFGLRAAWIEPPRPRRPDIWHFDLFGAVLREVEAEYPPPAPSGHGERDRTGDGMPLAWGGVATPLGDGDAVQTESRKQRDES